MISKYNLVDNLGVQNEEEALIWLLEDYKSHIDKKNEKDYD